MGSIAEAVLGGVILGAAAAGLLVLNGRVLGVSGIVGGIVLRREPDVAWRVWFLAGLIGAGAIAFALAPRCFEPSDDDLVRAAIAGIVVGVGVHVGSGCTSGHGVCGVSRMSKRSIVATITFCTTGALTVLASQSLGLAGAP